MNLKTSSGQLRQDNNYDFTGDLKKNGVDVATAEDLFGTVLLTGGGELIVNRYNVLDDGDTGYLFPLASSVPANTRLVISNPVSSNSGAVSTQGADSLSVDNVVDTSIIFAGVADISFVSTGTDLWRAI